MRWLILLLFANQVAGPLHFNATTVPEPPTIADVSGTWLALRESGDICRLDVDAEKSTGEMNCATGERLFRTSIRAVVLNHANLRITLDGSEVLRGEVVYGKFAAVYGKQQISFFKIDRIRATLLQLGGRLAMESPPASGP